MKLPASFSRTRTRGSCWLVISVNICSSRSFNHFCVGGSGIHVIAFSRAVTSAASVTGVKPTIVPPSTPQNWRSSPRSGHGTSTVSVQTGLGRPFLLITLPSNSASSQSMRIPFRRSPGANEVVVEERSARREKDPFDVDPVFVLAACALAQDVERLLHGRRALQVAAVGGIVRNISRGNRGERREQLAAVGDRRVEGGAGERDDGERGVVMDGAVRRFEDRCAGPRARPFHLARSACAPESASGRRPQMCRRRTRSGRHPRAPPARWP